MEQMIKKSIHKILAHSYLAYFLLLSLGLFLEVFFPMRISYIPSSPLLTIVCFVTGPVLILWAQHSSHKSQMIKEKTGQVNFQIGPYKYIRNPTHLGLLILIGGYTLASQAAVLFIVTGVAFIISNIFFRKYENLLECRHGHIYKSYKSVVRKIM
jgi:protein-S-isoprenylcysteine O-methyltransferase Ste14